MGLLDLFHKTDMFEEVKKCREENGFLIDVRTKEEFAGGRIPGSINIPLSDIKDVKNLVSDKNALICVYCLSGARAASAKAALATMDYKNVRNLGGIKSYKGKIER